MMRRVRNERVRTIKAGLVGTGPVVYWMSRDQRVKDNWALIHAQDAARERRVPLAVAFCLAPSYPGATMRHYGFLLKGLAEVDASLRRLGIPFFLLRGDPGKELPHFLRRCGASELVSDFDPLRIKMTWQSSVAAAVAIPFSEVDAHNIVPCWAASTKAEYGAYTLRPKLRRLLPEFLTPFPKVRTHPHGWGRVVPSIDWPRMREGLKADRSVGEVDWITPGERAAGKALRTFIRNRLDAYDADRNDPVRHGQSDLSPYLHFGQLSAQRAALEVLRSRAPERAKEAFLEELITRRELSDNFCRYTADYDRISCFPRWAQRTLAKHGRDKRDYVYTLRQFEEGKTHDSLWNAAQQQMVIHGKMHGYLRMYWAKKILEWSPTAAVAMRTAIYLNDRYELDGRDPNGYAGIAWSVGGVHDRPWGERNIFGMVRYMSEKGCRSKFDVDAYIRMIGNAAHAAGTAKARGPTPMRAAKKRKGGG
jgi:deoxyribodipyrimidine photo-lyase